MVYVVGEKGHGRAAPWYWFCACGTQRHGYGNDERKCRDDALQHQLSHVRIEGS